MTSLAVAEEKGKQVARPLRVLVPLIKEAIRKGVEAYAEAGCLLLEAKAQLPHGKFETWVQDNLGVGKTQSSVWMKLAIATHGRQKSAMADYSSLRDFQRRHLGHDRPTPVHPQSWHEPVKESIELAKRQAARIEAENLSRAQERDELRKLCLRIVDIGYRVLSKELHPDKGGSREAMARLSRAREILKAAAS